MNNEELERAHKAMIEFIKNHFSAKPVKKMTMPIDNYARCTKLRKYILHPKVQRYFNLFYPN